MKTLTLVAPLGALVALLAGCASEPERPEPPQGYFATYIEDDGTKKFQYTLEFPEQDSMRGNRRPGNMSGHVAGSSSGGMSGGVSAGSGGRGGRPPPGGGGGQDRFQEISKRLENSLEQELANSGFCHDGHRETERVMEPPTVYIRGECEETASTEDRENFPNDS